MELSDRKTHNISQPEPRKSVIVLSIGSCPGTGRKDKKLILKGERSMATQAVPFDKKFGEMVLESAHQEQEV